MKASTVVLPVAPLQPSHSDTAGPNDIAARHAAPRNSSPTVSVLRGAVAMFSTQPVTWGASLLSTIFVPRFLGDHGLGEYSIATAAASMVGIIAALGVPLYIRRQVAARPTHAAVEAAGALVLLGVSGVVLAGLLAVVLPPLGIISAGPLIIQLALANMALAGARDVLFSLLIGREQHGAYALLNAGSVVLGSLAGVGVLALGGGVTDYIVTQVVVQAASMVPAWFLARVRLPRVAYDPRLWSKLMRGGAPFLGWGLALAIRGQIGVLIVGSLLSAQVAGWYFAAQRIAAIPAFIPVVLATPLLPVLSRIAGDHDAFQQTLYRTLVAALILTILPTTLVISFAPAIPDLLGWQASFAPSVPVMMILALFIPFVTINIVLGTALIAINRERQWTKVAALTALINPTICLGIIPLSQLWFENGAIGLAIAEVVTEVFMMVGALVILPRTMIAPGFAWLCLRILIAGVGAGVTATAVLPSSLILAAVASGLVYLAISVALRVVHLTDVSSMREVILQVVRPR